MRRATQIKAAGQWEAACEVDRVVLDADGRHLRRKVLTGEAGTVFLLDLPHAILLRDGDGLMLDDGGIVRVAGLAEPLLELAAAAPLQLIRLAWHLGNRHTDVEIGHGKLRIRRDHVLEDLVARLGATVTAVTAPFNPEPGGPHQRAPHHEAEHHGG
jgi:urease accessory protein